MYSRYNQIVGACSGGVGTATNYLAVVMAFINAGEWAVSHGFENVCFRFRSLDSKAVILAFSSSNIPWAVETRWMSIKNNISYISVKHAFKILNISEDKLAKTGFMLESGTMLVYDSCPAILGVLKSENP